MKVTLVAVGTRGDVQPMLALGQTLQQRGHTVKIAAPPNFGKWITDHGFAFAPVGADKKQYLQNNPDVAEAHAKGDIADLRAHYVEHGYFEGRPGAAPPINEAYYTSTYRDVADAVTRGDVKSGTEHYLRSGAAEARIPAPELKPAIESWAAVLRDEAPR